jgi:hypothetical protein
MLGARPIQPCDLIAQRPVEVCTARYESIGPGQAKEEVAFSRRLGFSREFRIALSFQPQILRSVHNPPLHVCLGLLADESLQRRLHQMFLADGSGLYC